MYFKIKDMYLKDKTSLPNEGYTLLLVSTFREGY
jgi:hypothetical protein